jgi:hypothetical protein
MEQFLKVCQNPWCKAHFYYTENDFINTEDGLLPPNKCKKCLSFENELSGGIEWRDKTYEGSRWDGKPHQITYKVTNFKL